MSNPKVQNLDTASVGPTAGSSQRRTDVRLWAWLGLVVQVVFVASWLVAAAWQGPRYSVTAHTISDLYAVTAPHGAILVLILTLCGAATIGFALRSVWPVLRAGGWRAATGSILLALFERLVAFLGAAAVAVLAIGILRRTSSRPEGGPGR